METSHCLPRRQCQESSHNCKEFSELFLCVEIRVHRVCVYVLCPIFLCILLLPTDYFTLEFIVATSISHRILQRRKNTTISRYLIPYHVKLHFFCKLMCMQGTVTHCFLVSYMEYILKAHSEWHCGCMHQFQR